MMEMIILLCIAFMLGGMVCMAAGMLITILVVIKGLENIPKNAIDK